MGRCEVCLKGPGATVTYVTCVKEEWCAVVLVTYWMLDILCLAGVVE
jgi:hypothetical protein